MFAGIFLGLLLATLPLGIANALVYSHELPTNTIFFEDFEDAASDQNWFSNDTCTGGGFVAARNTTRSYTGDASAWIRCTAASQDADLRRTVSSQADTVQLETRFAFNNLCRTSVTAVALFLSIEYWDGTSRHEGHIRFLPGATAPRLIVLTGDGTSTVELYRVSTNNAGLNAYDDSSNTRGQEAWHWFRVKVKRSTNAYVSVESSFFTGSWSSNSSWANLAAIADTTKGSAAMADKQWGLEVGMIQTTTAAPCIFHFDNILLTDETPGGPGIVTFAVSNSAFVLALMMGIVAIVAVLNRMHIIGPRASRSGPTTFTQGAGQSQQNRDFTMVIVFVLIAVFVVSMFALYFKGLGA